MPKTIFMKALPWIIGIVLVIAIIYVLYVKQKKNTLAGNEANALVNGNTLATSPNSVPQQDACLTDPQIVAWVAGYPTAPNNLKPYLKTAIQQKCPAAAAKI